MSTIGFPLPTDERERLEALAQFQLVDTPPEADFERLAALAARVFNVPTVLVSLMDENRQFFKSRIGFDPCQTSRDISFCAHTILNDGIMVVRDALHDVRFKNNPLVVGPPHIRFYAGKPLMTATGYKIGTLCIIDSVPRGDLTGQERRNLEDLAGLIMERMEARRLQVAAGLGRLRFKEIAAMSHEAVFLCDRQERVTFWNRAAEALFGFSGTDMLVQQKLFRIIESDERMRYHEEMDRLLAADAGTEAKPFNIQAIRKDGTNITCEFSPVVLNDQTQKRVGFIARNVALRAEIETRLLRCLHSRARG